jgi:hypothetical protein
MDYLPVTFLKILMPIPITAIAPTTGIATGSIEEIALIQSLAAVLNAEVIAVTIVLVSDSAQNAGTADATVTAVATTGIALDFKSIFISQILPLKIDMK